MRKVLLLTLPVLVAAGAAAYFLRPQTPPPAPAPTPAISQPSPSPQVPQTPTPVAATPRPAPAPQVPAAPPRDLAFAGLTVEYDRDPQEACLRFNQALQPDANYRDFLDLGARATNWSVRVDGDRLCLAGLGYGAEYNVVIRAGMPSASGARTQQPETVQVGLSERPAQIAISGSGFVLPRQGATGLAIETINLDKVDVHVFRLGERALPLKKGEIASGEAISRYTLRYASSGLTLVWRGSMDVERKANQRVITAFPIAEAVKERKPGAYVVAVSKPGSFTFSGAAEAEADGDYEYEDSSEDYRSPFAARLIIETDIALTTYQGRDGLTVFARSLETAKPIPGLDLGLFAQSNEELSRQKTDGQGKVTFAAGLLRGAAGAAASVVMAYGQGGDFTALDLKRAAFDFSDRGVSGRPTPGPVDAFLYADRGIYRPGESVELMALARDPAVTALADLPLTLILSRPNGQEFRRVTVPPQAEGAYRQTFVLPANASRGMWAVAAHVDPKAAPVGRIEFDVQDFVPERLKVTASMTAKRLKPGDKVEVGIEGLFLYGAPAADLAAEAEVRLMPDRQPFPALKDWQFGREDDKFVEESVALDVEGTDAEGKATATGTLKALPDVTLPLKAQVVAGVFEPSGRVVQDRLSVPFSNRDVLIGIRPSFQDKRVQESTEAGLDLAAFDAEGNRIAKPGVRWRLYRELVDYTWYREGSQWTWRSVARDRLLTEGVANIAADAPFAIKERVDWGRFRLEVQDPASNAASSFRFRAGWAPTADAGDVPDKVDVLVEKPAYALGEKAKLRVVPPGAGEVQIAVATDRVLETRTFSVPAEGGGFDVEVGDAWGPGAYVLATWYRPLAEGRPRDPVRAVGLAWVGVDTAPRTLSVEIGAPEKMRPERKLDVPLSITGLNAGEQAYVTLAAVDEGILQLTRFVSPDPAKHYFGKRRLGVDMRDDYGRLLDGKTAAAGRIRSGGDIGGAGLPVVPTKSVALFSGPVTVGADGKATVSLDVPDFVGQLRLMAVAYTRTKVGKGEGKIIVRHPLVADAAFPRFLAPRDKSRMTVLAHNVEGPAGDYRLTFTASGPISLGPNTAFTYALGPNDRKIEALPLEATGAGIGTVTMTASGPDNLSFRREWQIAVRSPHYPITLEQEGVQANGASYRFDPNLLQAFEAGSASVAVNYSTVRGIDVAGLLQSLDRYPYGCTEQITSRALPLVMASELAVLANKAMKRSEAEGRFEVQKAVDTVLDRQDAAGTIGLWRNGDEAAWPWVETMAIELLLRAKEAGYVVPDNAIRVSLARLERLGRESSGRYSDQQMRAALTLADRSYALATLARAGSADIGLLRQMHDVSLGNMRGALAPAMLGAALSHAGDRTRAANAFKASQAAIGQTIRSDYYGSPLRDAAGALALAVESNAPIDRQPLFDALARLKKSPEAATTQEKLWLTRAAAAMLKEGDLTLAASGIERVTAKGAHSFRPGEIELAAGFAVANESGRDAYRTVSIHGAPREAPPALEAGFKVQKTFYALDGEKIDPASIEQHGRMVVSIQATARDDVYRQAVLVDLIPAGWEIETVVRRGEDGGSAYPFLGEISLARTREARDDRLVAAFDVGRPAYTYWWDESAPTRSFNLAYVIRAVVPGSYTLPGAVVEDMYKPGFMGRTATTQTVVTTK